MKSDDPTGVTLRLITHAPEETAGVGEGLARFLEAGIVVGLSGDLGAGKSVLARGVIRGLGVQEEYLPSPTFTLLNVYEEGRLPVYHFDLYRLGGAAELDEIGAAEFLEGAGVALVEWPERAAAILPRESLTVTLGYGENPSSLRVVTIQARGERPARLLHEFYHAFRVARPDLELLDSGAGSG